MSNNIRIIAGVVILGALAAGAFVFLGPKGSSSPPDVASGDLEIVFGSFLSQPITKWEISPAGTETYTELPLSEGQVGLAETEKHTIADGATICTYDMRITKADGTTADHMARNLCDDGFYTYYDEFPITFVNKTEHDFIYVVASPNVGTGGVSHGFKLPAGGFKAGSSIEFAIPLVENSCSFGYQFNIRMGTPGDAVVIEVKDVDLCEKWNGQVIDLVAG